MTERLYYKDSFLTDFEAVVTDIRPSGERTGIVLDRSAFYPTSGGQPNDLGTLQPAALAPLRVVDVEEDERNGDVLHWLEGTAPPALAVGSRVTGQVDAVRRHDHRQQHSGQHLLSAAFLFLHNVPTLSFHMGAESSTIDLDSKLLTPQQWTQAEDLANEVVGEDRPVEIVWATPEEARALGSRKVPPDIRGELRLIVVPDFDVNACGGTHVNRTGQVGAILLRKIEKTTRGTRVEFVCGTRAVQTARGDFATLTQAAALYSQHPSALPQQIEKSLSEIKAGQKDRKALLEELAELHAARLLSQARSVGGLQLCTAVFPEREAAFLKQVAHKIVGTAAPGQPAMVLLGSSCGQQSFLVFAQTAGGAHDMGQFMRRAMETLGGRGGGNREMAQGGVPAGADLQPMMDAIVASIAGGEEASR